MQARRLTLCQISSQLLFEKNRRDVPFFLVGRVDVITVVIVSTLLGFFAFFGFHFLFNIRYWSHGHRDLTYPLVVSQAIFYVFGSVLYLWERLGLLHVLCTHIINKLGLPYCRNWLILGGKKLNRGPRLPWKCDLTVPRNRLDLGTPRSRRRLKYAGSPVDWSLKRIILWYHPIMKRKQ